MTMNSKRAGGRPKVEKPGRRVSVYIAGDLAERLDTFMERQSFRPTMSQVIARGLEKLIDEDEKNGGKR